VRAACLHYGAATGGYCRRRLERVVTAQIAQRPWVRARNPVGNGALEERLGWLGMHVGRRADRITNRERLNRMLLLMMLHSNGFANDVEYAHAIHDWLLTNDGRPRIPRRAIADPPGQPSLRP